MIPPALHFVWVGGPMPDHLREYVASWRALHPQWDHHLWTEHELDWLENQELFDRAEEHTPHVGQFRSDIARYEILHRYGGVYVDCDFEARRPIDELCTVECFAAWETDDVWVNNAIVGATPGHPMLEELIAGLPANVARTQGRRPNVMTGPQYFTPICRRHHDVVVHPSWLFYPYRWDELHRSREAFPDAYAVHHWDNARKRRGVPRG